MELSTFFMSREEIARTVTELALDIDIHYPPATTDLVLVGVLKGALHLMSDLSREMTTPHEHSYIRCTSYSGTRSSGVVRIDLGRTPSEIRGRHVLLVEDIADSGTTLKQLVKYLMGAEPASLDVAVLLKRDGYDGPPVRFVGRNVPKGEFVVGYGLDLDGQYRDLPYITTMEALRP